MNCWREPTGAAYRRFGYDVVRVFTDLYVQAEAMGAKVRVPEDETAYFAGARYRQRTRRGSSATGGSSARMAVCPRIARQWRAWWTTWGTRWRSRLAVTGPFTNASFLVGAETLARLALREPAVVRHLCEISLETALRWADSILDAGASPSITDPMLSSTVVESAPVPRIRAALPGHGWWHIRGRGKSVTLHICGKTRPVWAADG